jgi:hypothetical protein
VFARTALAILCVLCSRSAWGGVTFLGPTPYLSAADSPFDLSSNFYLEDFEDGELNTPGVIAQISVLRFGVLRDSVDADDGVIDGSGSDGNSATAIDGVCTNTIPPVCSTSITFEFSEAELGRLPNAVGLVWTDGFRFPGESFTLVPYDRNGVPLGVYNVFDLGDDAQQTQGGTAEDRFFGVIYGGGIGSLYIRQRGQFGEFEFDHLQYGTTVPEPSTAWLLGLSLCAILLGRHFQGGCHVHIAPQLSLGHARKDARCRTT